MNWLRRLFTFGRLERAPSDHTAGRLLPPASVQLGLQQVDLPAGVVTLRDGEVRALLRVSGMALHHCSPTEGRALLVRWATALNALPADAALIVRSRPGGLTRDIRAKRDQTTALAVQAPGSGLAKLAADQLAHLRQLQARSDTQQTDCYVAVRNSRGDVRHLRQTVTTATTLLRQAGLRCELVREQALAQALAETWQPGIGEAWLIARTEAWQLESFPGDARVRPVPPARPERSARAARPAAALPRPRTGATRPDTQLPPPDVPQRKALP
jgi:hypothetical protein